jgi:hypothetical protein
VTFNARLLGTKLSLFSTICNLGYCVFPINITTLLYILLGSHIAQITKLIFVGVGFFWATLCTAVTSKFGPAEALGSRIKAETRALPRASFLRLSELDCLSCLTYHYPSSNCAIGSLSSLVAIKALFIRFGLSNGVRFVEHDCLAGGTTQTPDFGQTCPG